MKDLKKMQSRYMRDEWPVRLGHLASNLLRLNHWIQMRRDAKAIVDLMRESAWFMEWTASDAPPHVAAELADMQREICLWRHIWPAESASSVLAFRAHVMSERVLALSGLLDS